MRATCAVAGSVAAGYLWAAAFGKGIPGLETAEQLDRSDSFPDANAALLLATLVYVASPAVASWAAKTIIPRAWASWLVVTGLAGGVVFGLAALIA